MAGDGAPRPGPVIDLNADLGEGIGDDDGLLEAVTSANVACGFHAGGPSTMARVCERAVALGVAIGAHVSYWDRDGFGRRPLDVEPAAVRDGVLYQLGALDGFARAAGSRVAYVKPHGALYHRACSDPATAAAVVAATSAFGPGIGLLALPGSALCRAAAAAGLRSFAEGYLDRAYDDAGALVDRSRPGAVLEDASDIADRALGLALRREVVTVNGTTLALEVESLCTHGDTPGALSAARAVRRALEAAGVTLRAFSGT